jgi:pimeloyl-ACP methyl ester carboxylesterase
MWKQRLSLLTVLLLLLLAIAPTGAKQTATPPAPTRIGGGEVAPLFSGGGDSPGTPGTLYVGATPPNANPTKPVLLFVHGKGGSNESWWGESVYHGTIDMYSYAYNNGYRTAFVDLYPEGTMWQNGQLLASLINQTTQYFGVSRVAIIAHSKGGVDSNTAVEHYGAGPKVSRIITLGTPHWGTPIADMAYSEWTGWIADLLGEKSDAAYVMQTGYMSWFRSQTDPLGRHTTYYTLSGYKCGPVFTALWVSCAFISGEDDGLVGVSSARIPGGTHLKEGYWDHDEIRFGSRSWSWFAPVIAAGTASTSDVAFGERLAAASAGTADVAMGTPQAGAMAPGNLILRGDVVTGSATGQAIPLEPGVKEAALTLYGSSPDLTATLTGPDGQQVTVTLSKQVEKDQPLAGLWYGTASIARPLPGAWSLQLESPERAGYLLVTALDSPLQAKLQLGKTTARPGERQSVSLHLTGAALKESRASGSIRAKDRKGAAQFQAAGGDHQAQLPLTEAGIQNLSLTITGTTADGFAVERSVVTSFAVVEPGSQP